MKRDDRDAQKHDVYPEPYLVQDITVMPITMTKLNSVLISACYDLLRRIKIRTNKKFSSNKTNITSICFQFFRNAKIDLKKNKCSRIEVII